MGLYGAGQIKLLGGDTASAMIFWRKIVDEDSVTFDALRSMKTISDVYYLDGDTISGREWDRNIIEYFDDTTVTQQTRIIIDKAKNRLKST